MSHADVVALLDAAALVPGRIRALLAAQDPQGAALREHLAGCAECRGEVAAWQAVDEALVAVTPETMAAPAAAKARILSGVVATGVARGPDRILGATSPGATAPAASAQAVAVPAAVGIPVAQAQGPTSVPAPGASAPPPPMAPDPAVPTAGRVWRTPGGAPMPAPAPVTPFDPVPTSATAPVAAAAPGGTDSAPAAKRGLRLLKGGRDGEGIGFRVFLAVAAAAVFVFALGAALGGPLGLTGPATAPDTTARVELAKTMGRFSDLLQQPNATVAPLTDLDGNPAGVVAIALPQTNLLGVVTRALPALPDGGRYICIIQRGDQRYEIGYMKFADDPAVEGEVAYWVGPLKEGVPLDVGRPGDVFKIFVEGETAGQPLLSATF